MSFLSGINLNDLFNNFIGYIGLKSPINIIQTIVDIGIVSYVIYKVIILVRDTRAWQLMKGIFFILVANELSRLLGLKTIHFILNNIITVATIALVVLFQPELRRVLEQIGRSRFRDLFSFEEQGTRIQTTAMIEEIVKACVEMSRTYTGALIVIEGNTKIGEIINTGTMLD